MHNYPVYTLLISLSPPASNTSSSSNINIQKLSSDNYAFELYVCGMTRKSVRTIQKVKTTLNQELLGDYKLEIIDIFRNPLQTKNRQIMTTPTLIKKSPVPTRQIAGDITSKNRIICGLNITPKNRLET
jgi:circadian clock protein KaiB